MAKIYVSSTSLDLDEFREKVRMSIRTMGHEDVAMEYYTAENKRPLEKCRQDVRQCDVYIGIFAMRYGFIPPGETESITVLEYREAVRSNKECLLFLLAENASWPLNNIDFEHHQKLQDFKNEVKEIHSVKFFTSADNLYGQVIASLNQLKKEDETHFKAFRPLFQAPVLPNPFVPRNGITSRIKERILRNDSVSGSLDLFVLHGIPGGGKSTIAAALCHQEAVRQHFKDGIYWATLGQSPDYLSILVSWIHALGDTDYRPSTIEVATATLRNLLHTRTALLVIDDAWNLEDLGHLLVGGERCKMIVTTRRVSISDPYSAEPFFVNELAPEESFALLANKVRKSRDGGELSPEEEKWIRTLTEETGHLPLALTLIGALAARHYSWEDILTALRSFAMETDNSVRNTPMEKLEASILLSVNWLKKEDPVLWEKFCWLGVLAEDTRLNKDSTAVLWQVPRTSAAQLLHTLADEALLTRSGAIFTVHDFIYNIAKRYLFKPGPQGLGFSIQSAHEQLLQRYWSALGGKPWNSLPDDGYIHRHLFWHMENAKWIDEQREVLSMTDSDESNAWYVVNEELNYSAGFLDDCHRAWANEKTKAEPCISHQLQYALTISSIRTLSQILPVRILLALMETRFWSPLKVIHYIDSEYSLYKRAGNLLQVLPRLQMITNELDVADQPAVRTQMNKTIHALCQNFIQVGNSVLDASYLGQFYPYTTPEVQEDIARKMIALGQTYPSMYEELSHIVPNAMKDTMLGCACAYHAEQINDDDTKCRKLAFLAAKLSPDPQKKWIVLIEKLLDRFLMKTVKEVNAGESNPLTGLAGTLNNQHSLEVKDSAQKKHEAFPALLATVLGYGIPLSEKFLEKFDAMEVERLKALRQTPGKSPESTGSSPDEAQLTEEERFYKDIRNIGLLDAVPRIQKLPLPHERYVAHVLQQFHWAENERLGLFLIKVADFLPAPSVQVFARQLVEQGKDSAGVQCLLASAAAPADQAPFYEAALQRLKTYHHFRQKATELHDAFLSILYTAPRPIVHKGLKLVQYIGDDQDQVSLLLVLALLKNKGLPEHILTRWSDEGTSGRQIATLTKMVNDLSFSIKQNKLAEFIQSAAILASEWWTVEALTMTIRQLAEKEDLLAVARSAQHIHHLDLRARLLGRVAYRLAATGGVDASIEILGRIQVPIERWRTMSDVAILLAKNDRLAEAEKMADAIGDAEEAGKSLAEVALYHAVNQDTGKALALVRGIHSPHWKAYATDRLELASGQQKKGPTAAHAVKKAQEDFSLPGAVDFAALETAVIAVEALVPFPELRRAIGQKDTNQIAVLAPQLWTRKNGGQTLLDILSESYRPIFFENLKAISPLLVYSGSDTEVQEWMLTIDKVCRWWP